MWVLYTQRRSLYCEFQANGKKVQKRKVLCIVLQKDRDRSRKRN